MRTKRHPQVPPGLAPTVGSANVLAEHAHKCALFDGAQLRNGVARLSWLLAGIYVLDRALKMAAVIQFFRQPEPVGPPSGEGWPSVSLLQPITRGASNLPAALACRAALTYPGALQHILICDAGDSNTLALCRDWLAELPQLDATILAVSVQGQAIASKVEKLNAGLADADGEILCFVDDDINLRPDAVQRLVGELLQPGVGAVFGLACYTDWSNPWSSLLSGFVNSNALLNYIPLARLTEPYTITGHLYALKRSTFTDIGGLAGLDERIDDDHELARRVRRAGYRCVQSAVIYDVENHLDYFFWLCEPDAPLVCDPKTDPAALSIRQGTGDHPAGQQR